MRLLMWLWLIGGDGGKSKSSLIPIACICGMLLGYGILDKIETGLAHLRQSFAIAQDSPLDIMTKKANALFNPQSNQAVKVEKPHAEWQPIKSLLASTPARRLNAAQQLGLAKGEYYVAFVSIKCSDCDREILKLTEKKHQERIVAFTVAPFEAAVEWRSRLRLKYRVEILSQELFDDLGGVVLLPTIVHFKDGVAIGASETADCID